MEVSSLLGGAEGGRGELTRFVNKLLSLLLLVSVNLPKSTIAAVPANASLRSMVFMVSLPNPLALESKVENLPSLRLGQVTK